MESGDDAWDNGDDRSDMELEWRSRQRQFHTLGYRDGVSAGQEESAQKGFNAGFGEAVTPGFEWGLARGITSAFAALSPQQQEMLIPDASIRQDLKSLHTTTASISSKEAVTSYYSSQLAQEGESGKTSIDVGSLAVHVKVIAEKSSIGYEGLLNRNKDKGDNTNSGGGEVNNQSPSSLG